jgi:hypothetical protein
MESKSDIIFFSLVNFQRIALILMGSIRADIMPLDSSPPMAGHLMTSFRTGMVETGLEGLVVDRLVKSIRMGHHWAGMVLIGQ